MSNTMSELMLLLI